MPSESSVAAAKGGPEQTKVGPRKKQQVDFAAQWSSSRADEQQAEEMAAQVGALCSLSAADQERAIRSALATFGSKAAGKAPAQPNQQTAIQHNHSLQHDNQQQQNQRTNQQHSQQGLPMSVYGGEQHSLQTAAGQALFGREQLLAGMGHPMASAAAAMALSQLGGLNQLGLLAEAIDKHRSAGAASAASRPAEQQSQLSAQSQLSTQSRLNTQLQLNTQSRAHSQLSAQQHQQQSHQQQHQIDHTHRNQSQRNRNQIERRSRRWRRHLEQQPQHVDAGATSGHLMQPEVMGQPEGHSLGASGAGSAGGRRRKGVRKCRRTYGMAQRQLWCTQCKWKKACSRFSLGQQAASGQPGHLLRGAQATRGRPCNPSGAHSFDLFASCNQLALANPAASFGAPLVALHAGHPAGN